MRTLRDIFAFAQSAPDTGKAKGRSGTVNTRGFITEDEQNAVLRWPQSLRIYDEMRRTDATVRWMLALVATPIRSATWSVIPASQDPQDLEVAAFVEQALFKELDGGWDEFLRQALIYLTYGHAVFERVADLREVKFDYDVGEATTNVQREAFIISKLAPRLPRTILRWNYDPADSSQLASITQFLGDGQQPSSLDITADRLVVFTHEKEGDDWRGVSILRTAYKAWKYKRKLENLEAIAYERSAGLPVVYPPKNATDDDLDAVEAAVKRVRQGEELYIIMPGPKQGTTKNDDMNGWLVEDLAIKGDANANPDNAIQRYDSAMSRNVLAEFMRLGHSTQVGARAVGDVQQDPYYQSVEAHVGYIEDTCNQALIHPLVDWNYEVDQYPKLRASKIQAKNIKTITDFMTQLATAGVITADPELENWLRELVDAPDRDPLAPVAPPKAQAALPPGKPDPGNPDAQGPAPGEATMAVERFSQFVPSRPLTRAESFVAFDEILGVLNNAEADLPTLVEDALSAQIANLTDLTDQAVAKGDPSALDALVIDTDHLQEVIAAQMRQVYAQGETQVRAEVRRQQEAMGTTTMAQDRKARSGPAERDALIAAMALTAAQSIGAQVVRAERNRGLRQIATRSKDVAAKPGEDPLAAARQATKLAARGLVGKAFAMGRSDAIFQITSLAPTSVYSSVLDNATCLACEEADGSESPSDNLDPEVPNPDCAGGSNCRCQWLPLIEGLI